MGRTNSITSEYDRKKRFWELIESSTNETYKSNEVVKKNEVMRNVRSVNKVSLQREDISPDKIKKEAEPTKDFDKKKEFNKVLSNFNQNFVKETNKKPQNLHESIKQNETSKVKEIRKDKERFSSRTSTYHVLGLGELTKVNKGITGIKKKDDKEYVIEIKAGEIPKKVEPLKKEVKKEMPQVKKYTATRVTNTPLVKEESQVKQENSVKPSLNFTSQREQKRKNTILVTEPISPNSPLFSYSPKSKIIFNNNFKKFTLNTEDCFKNIKQNFYKKTEEKEESVEKSEKEYFKDEELINKPIEFSKEISSDKKTSQKSDEVLLKSIESLSVQSKESNKKENLTNNLGMKEESMNYKNYDKYEEITLSTHSTSTVNLYSPGKVLKNFPKLKILHIEYSMDDTFLIIKVNDWLIRKNYELIKKFIKPNEALTYDPYRNKINKEIIEINLNSKLMKDIPSLQSFILTDLIDNYSLRNDYLLMHDKEWHKVKMIKVNDKFILYKKNEIYKMFNKKDITLEKVNNLVFKLYLDNNIITLGVNSVEEMNEWIKFINS